MLFSVFQAQKIIQIMNEMLQISAKMDFKENKVDLSNLHNNKRKQLTCEVHMKMQKRASFIFNIPSDVFHNHSKTQFL